MVLGISLIITVWHWTPPWGEEIFLSWRLWWRKRAVNRGSWSKEARDREANKDKTRHTFHLQSGSTNYFQTGVPITSLGPADLQYFYQKDWCKNFLPPRHLLFKSDTTPWPFLCSSKLFNHHEIDPIYNIILSNWFKFSEGWHLKQKLAEVSKPSAAIVTY